MASTLSGKLAVEVDLKSSAQKFWEGITNSTDLFPKIFPGHYKSIEQVEGDGKSVGSIRKIVFGEGIPNISTVTEKIESYDEGKKTLSYSTIEGDLLNLCKVFTPSLEVVPNGDGCTAKWSVEYEKVSEEMPNPDMVVDMAKNTFENFDAYLLAN